MDKTVYQFEDFLARVEQDQLEFVDKIHRHLTQEGYKIKIEDKASGFFASYAHPKTKRSILNLLFRKKGLFARIYTDNAAGHADFLNALPPDMIKEIAKAPVCKRLINPEDCNPKCQRGYDFLIGGERYQKCRYSCFQFIVTATSMPVISAFVERETGARATL